MQDLLDEVNKIKSKRFYSNFTQTTSTFNSINNEVCNKMIQTYETGYASKKNMFTQTKNISFTTVAVQTNVENSVLNKTSRNSSSIYERLTGFENKSDNYQQSADSPSFKKAKKFETIRTSASDDKNAEIVGLYKNFTNTNLVYAPSISEEFFKGSIY